MLLNPPENDWLMWRRTYDAWGYSPLKQINTDNVKNLTVAWTWAMTSGATETTPLVHDGVLFLYNWLDKVQALGALHVLPDHSDVGDGSLVATERAFIVDLQSRALELKRQGKSADEAGQILLAEFKTKFADWPNLTAVPNVVKHVYAENQ